MLQWPSRAMTALGSTVQAMYGRRPQAPALGALQALPAAEMYRVMRAYYMSNSLYDELRDMLRRQSIWAEGLKPIRNPAYRVVEFHGNHIWPGTLPNALPIAAKRKTIIRPIQQVWQWSHWDSKKQVAARHLALYGDMFIKVSTTPAQAPQRVFFQLLEPEHVTDFDVDERDFLTYVRIDSPRQRRSAVGAATRKGVHDTFTHTEVWDKAENSYRVWEHQHGVEADLEQLGSPTLQAEIASFGIDFIPITHAKFADIGELRGMGALVPALDKIDEANRQATRLAQMLFRNLGGVWALKANAVGDDKRPLPPPQVNPTDAVGEDTNTITLGDDRLVKLPGLSSLESMVPNIDYEAALKILQDHMRELEQDLPELVTYRLQEESSLSGRAVRLMLGPAIKRLEEARGNAEGALVRADQMALTIGQVHGLFKPALSGTFDRGDFDHEFEARDVLPTDNLEEAQTWQAQALAVKALVEAGMPLAMACLQVTGRTDVEAFQAELTAAIKRDQLLAQEDRVDDDEPIIEQ